MNQKCTYVPFDYSICEIQTIFIGNIYTVSNNEASLDHLSDIKNGMFFRDSHICVDGWEIAQTKFILIILNLFVWMIYLKYFYIISEHIY